MRLAKDFLSRFEKLTPPDDVLRRVVANAVHQVTKLPTKKKDVSISNNVAFIKTSSIGKSVIRTKRGEVLEEVFKEFPKAREVLRDVR